MVVLGQSNGEGDLVGLIRYVVADHVVVYSGQGAVGPDGFDADGVMVT